MEFQIPVSVGEVIDKISILQIKKNKMKDRDKIKWVKKEEKKLLETLDNPAKYETWTQRLLEVNQALWEVEDAIREKERLKDFGQEFILLARSVYHLNDQRFELKNKINSIFESEIREMKSYCAC